MVIAAVVVSWMTTAAPAAYALKGTTAVKDPAKPGVLEVTYSDGKIVEVPEADWLEANRRAAALWSDLGSEPVPEPKLSRPVPVDAQRTMSPPSSNPATRDQITAMRRRLNTTGPAVRRGAHKAAAALKTLPTMAKLGTRFIPPLGAALTVYTLYTTARTLVQRFQNAPEATPGKITVTPVNKGDVIMQVDTQTIVAPEDGMVIARERMPFGRDDSGLSVESCRDPLHLDAPGERLEIHVPSVMCKNPDTGVFMGYGGRKQYTYFQPSDPKFRAPGDPVEEPGPGGQPLQGHEYHSGFASDPVENVDERLRQMMNDGVAMPEDQVRSLEWVFGQPEAGLQPEDRPNPAEPAPNPQPTPTPSPETQPETVEIPTPQRGVLYDTYADTLTDAGLVPERFTATETMMDPELQPKAVLGSDPMPGTRVPKGSKVRVRTNPDDMGLGPAPGTCDPWAKPKLDLGPLKVGWGEKFPFGLPSWLAGALRALNATRSAPRIVVGMPGSIKDLVLDAKPYEGLVEPIRPVFAAVCALMLAFSMLSSATGFRSRGVQGGDE